MKHAPPTFVVLALLAFPVVAEPSPQESDSELPETQQEAAWSIAVIKLEYANAYEVAALLSQILPPTIRVVPYAPTNSLLIAGDPAILGTLTEGVDQPRP